MFPRLRLLPLAALLAAAVAGRADDWPQWLGPKRDSVWRETGILDAFPKGGPKVLWRAKIAGGYSGPAVAGGKVYVMDFVTDTDTGKVSHPNKRPKVKGKERVLCLDAKDGKEVWKHEYDCTYEISYPAGPRCTPTVQDGKVYTLGAMGDLFCLDAAKGKVLWAKDFKKEYKAPVPMWGFCGHPLVDAKKLFCIVGGKDSVAVAFDKDTGKELWKALSAKEAGYSAPTLIEAAGKKQLVIWHGEAINGLGPEDGAVYWSVPLAPYYGMSIMTPRQRGKYLFAGGIVGPNRCALLELDETRPGAKVVWRGGQDTGLYPVNMTPFLEDGVIYGVDQPGPLVAVELTTGKRLWKTVKPFTDKEVEKVPSATAFLVKNGERFFVFSETGELIVARLSKKGYEEVSRWKMLEPTHFGFDRKVLWSHPAFAEKCVFARNDKEIVCASLAK
jgi:outer membrane protein assembly factor BamB